MSRRRPISLLGARLAPTAVALALFALVLTALPACNGDPDRRLVSDIFGLIDEFYLTATKPADLSASCLEGLGRSLAAKQYREQLEAKQKEAKDPSANPDSAEGAATNAPQETPDATPTPEPTATPAPTPDSPADKPTPAADNPADGDGVQLNPQDNGGTNPLDPYDLPEGEDGELPPGPLAVAIDGRNVTLKINGVTQVVNIPEDRNGAVDAFLNGYRFVSKQLGGDPDQELFNDALGYMTYRLDPHSQYMPAVQYGRLRDETSGHFGGVGIEVGVRNDQITVIAPIPGTPASEAGLLPMDLIVKVDGVDTLGLSLTEAVDRIRGEIGTAVTLSIKRGDNPTFDVKLERADIPVNSIKAEALPGGVGWVRVFTFNQNTAEDLAKALAELDKSKTPVRALILDMRNNPGGLLDQAIAVADEFLSSGMIVNTIGRGRLSETEKFATGPGTRGEIPMIVLINSVTASGSEIVAGALQDHHRALILGTRSFGKGSVQSIFRLRDDAGLRLTTALYYTPSGRSIQAAGIVPDVLVKLTPEEEKMLAMYWSESSLTGHLKSQAVIEQDARVVFDENKTHDHYLATGEIVDDDNFPEKGDWLLVLARHLLDGEDLSLDAMIGRAEKIAATM